MLETKMSKDRDGWTATTRIVLDTGVKSDAALGDEKGDRVLRLVTCKANRGGLFTYASVAIESEGWTTTAIFGDYNKVVAKSADRCTEAAVRRMHDAVLTQVDATVAEAKAFYAAKAKTDAAADLEANDELHERGMALLKKTEELANAPVPGALINRVS